MLHHPTDGLESMAKTNFSHTDSDGLAEMVVDDDDSCHLRVRAGGRFVA